jgi:predicted nucleic acid-binding protein
VPVIDASVIVPALADDTKLGDRARRCLGDAPLCAPEILDLEVASAVRRQVTAGQLNGARALAVLEDLKDLYIDRIGHRALVARCWELRDNLTIYDAAYVALAEALDMALITADGRLARAPGVRCRIELIA